MAKIRANIELKQTGIERGLSTRTTATEAIVFEVFCAEPDKNAAKLASLMSVLLKEREGVRVSRPKKMAEIGVRGMKASVTEEETGELMSPLPPGCGVERGAGYRNHDRIVPDKGRPPKRPDHALPSVSGEGTYEREMPRRHRSVARDVIASRSWGIPPDMPEPFLNALCRPRSTQTPPLKESSPAGEDHPLFVCADEIEVEALGKKCEME
ncbi:hypothetical protein KM043_008058 [Ampulex compressa]|nr:hypothetical protein KM043_008058 [Ampulex compressa]